MFVRIKIALAAAASVVVFTGAAQAAPPIIEDAKDQCIVGERNDGYLGVVDEDRASNELRRAVASINQQRKRVYAQTASRTPGASIEDAAKVAAQELVERAQAGHCVQDESGAWVDV